jgi:phage baseplate assembly protein W
MIGMNAKTGRALAGVPHLSQSISKILTTPLYSRVNRRLFGAELIDLVDAPNNAATRVRLYAAVATALMRYEPRLRLTRVRLSTDPNDAGKTVIEVEGTTDISRDAVTARVSLTPGA